MSPSTMTTTTFATFGELVDHYRRLGRKPGQRPRTMAWFGRRVQLTPQYLYQLRNGYRLRDGEHVEVTAPPWTIEKLAVKLDLDFDVVAAALAGSRKASGF